MAGEDTHTKERLVPSCRTKGTAEAPGADTVG